MFQPFPEDKSPLGSFGGMERGKWSPYNQAANGYLGRTVREVLEIAFWDSLRQKFRQNSSAKTARQL